MASGNNYTNLGLSSDLIAIAQRKANKLVKDGFFSYNDLEDLQQELVITLWQAIRSYEKENQTIINKQAFAQDIVNKKSINLIDKIQTQRRGNNISISSLHDSINDDGNYLLIDTISSETTFCEFNVIDAVEQIEFEIDLNNVTNKLPDDLYELYKDLQIMSLVEISKVKRIPYLKLYRMSQKLKSILIAKANSRNNEGF